MLRPDGTLWLNLGDTYSSRANAGRASTGIPSGGTVQASHRERVNTTRTARPKSLLLMPSRVALALQADGWIVRNDIVWHKPNAMPETVTDRLASRYEHLYHLLTRQPRYSFDIDAIRACPTTQRRSPTWKRHLGLFM